MIGFKFFLFRLFFFLRRLFEELSVGEIGVFLGILNCVLCKLVVIVDFCIDGFMDDFFCLIN